MPRPYKGYRAARAIHGHDRTSAAHRSTRYDVARSPVITASAVGTGLSVTLDATAIVPDGSAAALAVDWENNGTFFVLEAPEDFEFTYDAAGEKTIVVKARADDGFESTKQLVVTLGGVAAPTVASLDVVTGPEAGGTAVTITGTNLTGATAVTFGGVAATAVVVVGPTSITCETPAGTGLVDVAVTTPGGVATLPDAFTYTA